MPFKTFVDGKFITNADVDSLLMSQAMIRCTSGTHPANPGEGWHIYETDTQNQLVYKSGVWQKDYGLDTIGSELYVVKPSDESSASSSDHNDTHLFVNLAAPAAYIWEGFICVSSSSSGQVLDMDLSVPSDAYITWSGNWPISAEEGFIYNRAWTLGTISTGIYVSTNGTVTYCKGFIRTTTTSGTFRFVWSAQGGVTLTVKRNSELWFKRVG